jgi:hypothetical protein
MHLRRRTSGAPLALAHRCELFPHLACAFKGRFGRRIHRLVNFMERRFL